MTRTSLYLLGAPVVAALSAAGAEAAAPNLGKIAPEVMKSAAALSSGQTMTVIVRMKDEADLKPIRNKKNRAVRSKEVETTLKTKSDTSQRSLRSLLQTRRTQKRVSEFTPFWVLNGVSVTATAEVIQELGARSDVLSVTSDDIPVVPLAAPPEPNLVAIGVPDIWNLGLFGQGVVVASLDSGVDYTHLDLASGWRGGGNSWYDPYGQHATPYDPTGHGTWTMGVIVGKDAGGTSIGVAPAAKWIAAKIFKDNGTATATAIHQAFQWLLDPDGNPATVDAPNVVNNSWAYGSPGCNLEFQPDLQALAAAGVVPVFAAGNAGPLSNTSVSPSNYPEAFAVAATDNNDQRYAYSSSGPSACGGGLYPTLVAPGVNIVTTDLFGLYNYAATGTSIAAPHVAGALALLLGAYPDLTVDQQRQALTGSALDLGDTGPDNIFGYGRLNLPAAQAWLVANVGNPAPTPAPTPVPTPPSADSTGPATSGVSAGPTPNNGTLAFDSNTPAVRLIATVSDPLVGGIQSTIGAAETFIDTVGGNGSGLPASAADGAFDSPTETANTDIPLASIAQLSEGPHTLWVHGRDSAGNWGPAASTALIVDKTPPALSAVGTSPNPTNGAQTLTLAAVATDARSSVVAAEWFEGADPGAGQASAMNLSGTGPWNLSASVGIAGWTAGNHALQIRAKDAAGNWSAATTVTLAVTASDAVFADGFESGDFAAWNGGVAGNRLSATAAAATAGGYGMQAALGGGTAPGYVRDDTPSQELSYHARFYFNPHGALTGNNTVVTLFSGQNAAGVTAFQVQYRIFGRTASSPRQLRLAVLRSGGTAYSNWFTVSDNTAHAVEIAWQSFTGASASLYIDGGSPKQTLSGLNTSGYTLDSVRLGPSAGLAGNASGGMYFDAFASTRSALIGP